MAAQEKPRVEDGRRSIQAATIIQQQRVDSRRHVSVPQDVRRGHALDGTGYRGPRLIAYMANGRR